MIDKNLRKKIRKAKENESKEKETFQKKFYSFYVNRK